MQDILITVTNPKSLPSLVQDPQATRHYAIDWTNIVSPQTVASAAWSSTPSGLTIGGTSTSSIRTYAQISGGTVGQTYRVSVRMTDSLGDIDEQSFLLKIQDT